MVAVCRFYSLRRFKPNPELIAKHTDENKKEPHMLHVVWKIRSVVRRPHWEKKIMKQFGLEKRFQPVILKNIPEINNDLTKVRHLIRVKPLILNQGLPNGDHEETLVTWSGELIRKPKLDVEIHNNTERESNVQSEETKKSPDGKNMKSKEDSH
ncbi:putative 39S ribosomal protein L30, mitochondrial [Apostichopus japonicus]|uniref:Large ribosomal subunit protein uL30m n=1 Tax=Stichopus japonicus TaxID=307972 RepID=A0A2G8K8M9_STIJA|nr:putative 39S ribosomal protein L30, mitochondrial [Apostichopus japonicus]